MFFSLFGSVGFFWYIRWMGWRHLFPSSPFSLIMSSPFLPSPFSFKNDASAPGIVEAMEQVGIPASLCLKWAYGFPLGNGGLSRRLRLQSLALV